MLQVYVAHDRCGWLDASGSAHWLEEGDLEGRLAQCVDAAAKAWPRRGLRGAPVKVWVSGALARPFLLGPVAGLKGGAEIRGFAQSQVLDATGWDQSCQVRLEGDVTKGRVLATAMPAAVHARIEALVQRAKLRLVSLRPWWAGALDQALAAQPGLEMLVVEEPESLVMLAGQQGTWSMVEVLMPKPSPDEALRAVRRLMAGSSVRPEMSARLCLNTESPGALGRPWPVAQPSTGEWLR